MVTVGSDFATFLSAAPKSQRQMMTYHTQPCILCWLCNLLLYMGNAKYDNHMPVTRLAKRNNDISSRLLRYPLSTHSQCGTILFTLSMCFPAYNLVFQFFLEKCLMRGMFSLLLSVTSHLPSSSFSVLSDSSVVTVPAYYLHSAFP